MRELVRALWSAVAKCLLWYFSLLWGWALYRWVSSTLRYKILKKHFLFLSSSTPESSGSPLLLNAQRLSPVFLFLHERLTVTWPANNSQLTRVAHSMCSMVSVFFLRAWVLDGGTSGAVGDSCVVPSDCSRGTENQCQQLMGHLKGLTPCSHSSPNNLPPYPRTNPHRDLWEQLWCPVCVSGLLLQNSKLLVGVCVCVCVWASQSSLHISLTWTHIVCIVKCLQHHITGKQGP